MPLGDVVGQALAAVGIDEERVERWLGKPCNCKDRRERLNALHGWAKRITMGRIESAANYLDKILGGDDVTS